MKYEDWRAELDREIERRTAFSTAQPNDVDAFRMKALLVEITLLKVALANANERIARLSSMVREVGQG